jgi:hypothetical protein
MSGKRWPDLMPEARRILNLIDPERAHTGVCPALAEQLLEFEARVRAEALEDAAESCRVAAAVHERCGDVVSARAARTDESRIRTLKDES